MNLWESHAIYDFVEHLTSLLKALTTLVVVAIIIAVVFAIKFLFWG